MLRPQRFGRYILLDRLSTGGMAEVFLAKSSGLQGFEKIVAIKRILPAISEDSHFTTMFVDEAKISANLVHANIGQIFDFGQVNGQYYIAMEYIPGRDLRSINNRLAESDRRMPVPMALHIVTRLCQALDCAHRQKTPAGVEMDLVHRDVSPPNVIISFDGAVKLIDFGIAKAASRATKTGAGKVKGKFSYMSPEQVQGIPVDRRSDLFSLGVLLHEMLTGRRLFHGESQLATLNLVRRAEVDPPSEVNPEIPPEVDRIVARALARDREQRYGWANELRSDLERFLAQAGLVFESQQLARWMQTEFAAEIHAERLLHGRLQDLTLEEPPAAATVLDPGPAATVVERRPVLMAEPESAAGSQPVEPPELVPSGMAAAAPASAAPTSAALLPRRRRTRELPVPAPPPARAVSRPRVHGPGTSKADERLAHVPTLYSGPTQTPGPQRAQRNATASQRNAIAPGPQRDAATVGGALEVGRAARPAPKIADEEPVDISGLGPLAVDTVSLPPAGGGAPAATPSVASRQSLQRGALASGWTGPRVVVMASLSALALGGIGLALLAVTRGPQAPVSDGGSVVVTSSPHASCSVALEQRPKGLLRPGGSLTLAEVPAGRHLITLQCLGFEPYRTTVEVKAAQASFVTASLRRKP